jgi:hypothetical protein
LVPFFDGKMPPRHRYASQSCLRAMIARDKQATRDGNLVIAESGVNSVGLVEIK